VQAIKDKGFNSIDDLLDMADDQIDKLVKHIGQWQDRNAATAPNVSFPFLCVQKIKAICWWASLCVRQGIQAVDVDDFTNAVCKTAIKRLQEEKEINKAQEDLVPAEPQKLGWDLLKWPKFWEGQGAAAIPLTYLIREEEAIDLAAAPGNYNTVDDYLIARTMLEGHHFKINNARLYNEVKPLLVDSAGGWAFVKQFDGKMGERPC
jgi:hypothetical protein